MPDSVLLDDCQKCKGDGGWVSTCGWEVPINTLHRCERCDGTGKAEARCSVCCHEMATIYTGDAELPFACDDCAKEFEVQS